MPQSPRKRIDIASIRRQQIVQAASDIIAEQGLQKLSLSEIEKKVQMSRGQLTYYFPTKEDILLAVFDHMIEMFRRHQPTDGNGAKLTKDDSFFLGKFDHVLQMVLEQPPRYPTFHSLQHTFLAQISHREDFRQRLASLYEHWRQLMTADIEKDSQSKASPRAMATVAQAIIHGLAVQAAAAPDSFDPEEVVDLCLDMLGRYLKSLNDTTSNGHATKRRKSKQEH